MTKNEFIQMVMIYRGSSDIIDFSKQIPQAKSMAEIMERTMGPEFFDPPSLLKEVKEDEPGKDKTI